MIREIHRFFAERRAVAEVWACTTAARSLYHLSRFRACRLFCSSHCHVNDRCPLVPAEWEEMRNDPSTYGLFVAFAKALREG